MKILNRSEIKPIEDACESLQEMHHSPNMSISYATITKGSKPHKHLKMEEVYYIVKGKARMKIGTEVFDIKSGDIIPIPKGEYHSIESVESPIELVVVTHPRFDPKDLIYWIMSEELKFRISDYKAVERSLLSLGAKFSEELDVVDTYFNQKNGTVLKITEDDKGEFLVKLRSKNGKFYIIRYEPITEVTRTKLELSKRFGVKYVLKKKRRFFHFEDYLVNINLIEAVGKFLIVEGDNLDTKTIIKKPNITNPEFVRVSFDELKK